MEIERRAIPVGVVVTSTVECGSLVGEWEPYNEGFGKFILGAGKGTLIVSGPHSSQEAGTSVPLTEVRAGAQGGTEKHELHPDEMPAHNHAFTGASVTIGGNNGTGRRLAVGDTADQGSFAPSGSISSTGMNKPHNNMPPYIALHFCRKKAG